MSTGINIKKKLAILNEGANVTTDASSIDFVGSGVNTSTVGNDVTVTIPGGSGNTTYYMNATVPETPYAQFSSVATTAVEQVLPWTVDPGDTETAFVFQTPSGVPNTTQIPGGLWQFFLHFSALSINENWIIRPTVYKRDLGGTETLLFTADPQIINNLPTVTTMYVCDGVFPATTLLTTDRLVVKIALQNTGVSTQTLNFRTEGSQHYSVAFTTLNQVIAGGSVTSVTGTAPIVSSGGTTPAISIPQATAIADGYLSSSDWSVFNAKVPATRNITINGTTQDLSADRTWTVSAATGIWGIANSSGVYTYYATWALAVASAVSGQCIELFADITENSVSYTLKNGVNINGNGHSVSFSVVDGFVATSSPTICQINNIVINQATASVNGLYINANGSIIGGNATFNSNNASSNGVFGTNVARIYGFTCNGYNPISSSNFFSPNAVIDNVYVNSLGGSGLTTGTLSNSIISSSSTSYPAVGAVGTVNNCYIYGNGYSPVEAASEINNSTIISTVSRAINSNTTLNNCWVKSLANTIFGFGGAIFNNCTLIGSTTSLNSYLGGGKFNNCTLTASASAVVSAFGTGLFSNCNIICNWNNSGGYAFNNSSATVTNSTIQLANSSSYAFFSSGSNTMYLSNNGVKGSVNFKNDGITNGQTNTADAQGNLILQ